MSYFSVHGICPGQNLFKIWLFRTILPLALIENHNKKTMEKKKHLCIISKPQVRLHTFEITELQFEVPKKTSIRLFNIPYKTLDTYTIHFLFLTYTPSTFYSTTLFITRRWTRCYNHHKTVLDKNKNVT